MEMMMMLKNKMKSVSDEEVPISKHEGLMQDYLALAKETEAAKRRLKKENNKKATLDAEVRFLRRRYKQMMQLRTVNELSAQDIARDKFSPMMHRQLLLEQNFVRNRIPISPAIHGRLVMEQSMSQNRTPMIYTGIPVEQSVIRYKLQENDSQQKHEYPCYKVTKLDKEIPKRKATARNKSPVLTRETLAEQRNLSQMVAVLPNPHRVLDLNLISNENEVEEIQMLPLPPRTEKSSKRFCGARGDTGLPPLPLLPPLPSSSYLPPLPHFTSIPSSNNVPPLSSSSDLSLLVFRDKGQRMNPPENRKISWQDPVALKV